MTQVTKKKKKKISGVKPSKPIESLVKTWAWQNVVNRVGKEKLQIIDYYCGKGDDYKWLNKEGYNAVGFDPKYCQINKEKNYDIVLCTYVLNKIEDEEEWEDVMYEIGQLAGARGVAFLTASRNKPMDITSTIINKTQHFTTYIL